VKSIKSVAVATAVIVFVLCVYAFLLGNEVFDSKFKNEAIACYILAKGIFCSVALVALSRILDGVIAKLKGLIADQCECNDGRTLRKTWKP
jgi:hypothetical protein